MRMTRTIGCLALLAILLPAMAPAWADGVWTEDYDAAKKQAKAEGKAMLLDFTGSDWCGWCIRLDREVFDTEEFKTEAPKHFVLVKLDYPRDKPQTEAIKKQNTALQQKYQIRGYPTILLTDAEGEVFGQMGYQRGGPKAFLAKMDKLSEKFKVLQKAQAVLAEARKLEGVAKARKMDEALSMMVKVGEEPKLEVMEQIVAADPENQAGLKQKYEGKIKAIKQMAEVEKQFVEAMKSRDMAKAIKVIDDAIANLDLPGDKAQQLLAGKAQLLLSQRKFADAVKVIKQAVAKAPKTELAGEMQSAIPQIQKMIDKEK